MRGLALLLLSVSIAGGVVAACSSFDGEPAVAADAGRDAQLDAGTDALDGDAPASDMVAVSAGKTFLIDRTEVTFGKYTEFANAAAQDAGFHSIDGCAFKTAIGPPSGCVPLTAPTDPMSCVDWCDAVAYCKFRGKRLCGAINGGTVSPSDTNDPQKSQWTRACSNTLVADTYPYGVEVNTDACNTIGAKGSPNAAVPVGSFQGCVGGVPGLFDMSGNVEEWTDSCTGMENGANDNCTIHGGSYAASATGCSSSTLQTRNDTKPYRGFRCCKDVP